MADNFCSNYTCEVVENFAEVCLTFFKGPWDLDCHLECALANCSFTTEFNTDCITYNCMGPQPPSPTPGPTPGPSPTPSPTPGPSPTPRPNNSSALSIGFATGKFIK